MDNDTTRAPRRRPVDALFGEDVDLKPKEAEEGETRPTPPPGYMVEPPRPVTSVRPPPPEFPNDWRPGAPPEPARLIEIPAENASGSDAVALPPRPAHAKMPPAPVAPEPVTFTRPAPPEGQPPQVRKQGVDPLAVAMAISSAGASTSGAPAAVSVPSPYGQAELIELSQFVDQLYQNVADETSDSAFLNAECLANLSAARAALEKHEYATAEAAAETVKARLLRARASRTAAASGSIGLLFGWLIVAAVAGVVVFALPLFLRIVPEIIPFLRGISLGMLGGALVPLWQIPRRITRREYDAALAFKFALSPVLGALIGAVLYVLSVLGILAAPYALGLTAEPFRLMYVVALLGGLFNDVVIEALRGLVPPRSGSNTQTPGANAPGGQKP